MAVQSILGVTVESRGEDWYWKTGDTSRWRFGGLGLFRVGRIQGSRRRGWVGHAGESDCLKTAVAITIGWADAMTGYLTSRIAEVCPTLYAAAVSLAGVMTERASANQGSLEALPSKADYARAASMLRSYTANLDAIGEVLSDGALSVGIALGNAKAEVERLERLAGADDQLIDPDEPPPAA